MPTLTEQLEAEYAAALKRGERVRVDTLRLIKAGIQLVAIEQRKEALGDEEVLKVLAQQAKQRQETIDAAKQGGRQDVLDRATEELAILKSFLPEPLSQEALTRLIEEAIQEVGPNQGLIMKHVMGKAAGRADGKTVSQLVGARLKPAAPKGA